MLIAMPVAAAEVVDGDTFRLGGDTIRIENIDAPETHQAKCDAERRLGDLATERLAQLLASGDLQLSRNPEEPRDEDRYGRKLRRVAVGGIDVGATLVSEGLARRWTGKRRGWC